MANSPLQPPTLATFRSWGIQQELVICRHKSTTFLWFDKRCLNYLDIFLNLMTISFFFLFSKSKCHYFDF